MKIRNGFVSNSSSSSFVIRKDLLTPRQLEGIYDHESTLPRSNPPGVYMATADDAWRIMDVNVSGMDCVRGETYMDNFDIGHYMTEVLGIDSGIIEWSEF